MNHKKTLIALAVIMMAIVPASMMMSDESDAKVDFGDIWGSGFTTSGPGTLNVVLTSTEYDDIVGIDVIVTENGVERGRTTVTVPANDSITAEVRFSLDGAGTHYLRVTCEPPDTFPPGPNGQPINYIDGISVEVTVSIWSNTTTYLALIVVAILVVIAVYLRMRSAPVTKPKMTFTELEKQKAAERGEVEEKPKASATERRRYGSSEQAINTPPKTAKPEAKAEQKVEAKPEESKPTSFTELDKQKKEAAKKKSSDEPKKLKYVSSRRK